MENEDKFLFEGQECLSHACLFVHTSLKVFNSCLWYLYSGCSCHMTVDKSLFKSLKEKIGDFVTFGNESHAQVLGKGTIEIPELPLLKDVLYIKGLKANLLSITQICDEDFLVRFSKKGCIIIDKEGIQVLEERELPTIATEWFLRHQFPTELLVLTCWNFGIKDSDMLTSNKWLKSPNLKLLRDFQNLERWRKPFVVHAKWGSKQRQVITR